MWPTFHMQGIFNIDQPGWPKSNFGVVLFLDQTFRATWLCRRFVGEPCSGVMTILRQTYSQQGYQAMGNACNTEKDITGCP